MNGARLLVVDDEEINREISSEYLGGEEYELTMVENGERALAALGAQSFDAVILDRMMPGLDGLEVLRRMQHDARLRVVPVIMQTAAAGHDQVAEGLRLGAYYYLTKPYHRDSLVAVVNSAVDVMRRRRALSREIEQYQGLLVLLDDGRFRVRTLPDAHALAAGLGTLAADSPSVALGLVELLINGIEHGNLGIKPEHTERVLPIHPLDGCGENRAYQSQDRTKVGHDLQCCCDHRPHWSQRDMQNVKTDQPEQPDSKRVLELGNRPAFERPARGA